jgi:hypothetical protein
MSRDTAAARGALVGGPHLADNPLDLPAMQGDASGDPHPSGCRVPCAATGSAATERVRGDRTAEAAGSCGRVAPRARFGPSHRTPSCGP